MRINLCYHVSSNRYLCNLNKNRNEEYRKMIGLLKNGQKVEVKKIIPDWNRVETNDNQIFALWEFEVIYSS